MQEAGVHGEERGITHLRLSLDGLARFLKLLKKTRRPPHGKSHAEDLQGNQVGVSDSGNMESGKKSRDLGNFLEDGPFLPPLEFFGSDGQTGMRRRRNGPEVSLHDPQGLIRMNVSHDHDRRIVGGIVRPVVFPAILQSQASQVRIPADDRPAVRVLFVGEGHELLDDQAERAVYGTELAFAPHHFPFRLQALLRQPEILQAIRFQTGGQLQTVRREVFIIGGVVRGSEGVERPAVSLNDPREFLRAHLPGSFEHHVLEEMGDPGDARPFIAGAGGEVNLEGDHGQEMDFADQNAQAVGQMMFGKFRKPFQLILPSGCTGPGSCR